MSLFQSNLRKQIRNLPKILNFARFVKKIHYYSKLFTSLLRWSPPRSGSRPYLKRGSGAVMPSASRHKPPVYSRRARPVRFLENLPTLADRKEIFNKPCSVDIISNNAAPLFSRWTFLSAVATVLCLHGQQCKCFLCQESGKQMQSSRRVRCWSTLKQK